MRKTLWLALVSTLTLSFHWPSDSDISGFSHMTGFKKGWVKWTANQNTCSGIHPGEEWQGMLASGHQMALHCELGASHRPTVIFSERFATGISDASFLPL